MRKMKFTDIDRTSTVRDVLHRAASVLMDGFRNIKKLKMRNVTTVCVLMHLLNQ